MSSHIDCAWIKEANSFSLWIEHEAAAVVVVVVVVVAVVVVAAVLVVVVAGGKLEQGVVCLVRLQFADMMSKNTAVKHDKPYFHAHSATQLRSPMK